jgi:hypothetical protein
MGGIELVDEGGGMAVSGDSHAHTLQQMELTFEVLNLRIARLAIALGLSLKNEDTVAQVFRHRAESVPPQERRSAQDRREASRGLVGSAERRVSRSWDELRGLLVLRYDAQTQCVKQVGAVATNKILMKVEDHLVRRGFKPGDDGTALE